MKTTFEFISTKDQLPSASGTYITINASGTLITTLPFSTRHQAFNARDCDGDADYAINIAYWAEIPNELDDVMSKIWEDMKDE